MSRDIPMEDKVEKALVGVAEEEGLKKLMESDDSSEDDEDDPGMKKEGGDGCTLLSDERSEGHDRQGRKYA